jgi:hypothetical protein
MCRRDAIIENDYQLSVTDGELPVALKKSEHCTTAWRSSNDIYGSMSIAEEL